MLIIIMIIIIFVIVFEKLFKFMIFFGKNLFYIFIRSKIKKIKIEGMIVFVFIEINFFNVKNVIKIKNVIVGCIKIFFCILNYLYILI